MISYFVIYRVDDKPEVFEAGPYPTFGEAFYHKEDIRTYVNIWDVHIIEKHVKEENK